MDWKTMLAYMTGSVNEELLRRNEYLAAEHRILRAHLPGRVPLRDGERRSLTTLGPIALAFLAGYSVELVFATMDRIVSAFVYQGSRENR